MDPQQQFITHRRSLKSVSRSMAHWYIGSLRAFGGDLESREVIQQRIVNLRERGVSAISAKSYFRSINVCLR